MKTEEYEQVYGGEPFTEPKGKYWKLACCHCGLVHEVKIEDDQPGVARITMRENVSATRRHRRASLDLKCKSEKERTGKAGKRKE